MYQQLPMYQRVGNTAFKKDLTNTIKLLKFLGNPHQQFKSIHIAGTNGKGSSAHMLASVLQTSGYRTGLYTSPHLKQFTERIKIDGMEVDEAFVCEFIEKLRNLIEDIRPSFFEITVAMAFDYFAREDIDLAIVEVGMGGRFDSTNVLLPIISLITSISYDHMEFLGHTLPEIAFEKAGIIKPGVPVVISETQGEIVSVFDEKAEQTKSPIYYADQEFKVRMDNSVSSGSFDFSVETPGGTKNIRTDLGGNYQKRNIPGVLKTIELLQNTGFSISENKIKKGFQRIGINTGIKGRWQKLSDQPLTICDTAHNESGVQMIFEQIKKMKYHQLHVVWGAVDGKSIEKIFRHLPKNAFYYFCEPKLPRAIKAQKLLEVALDMNLQATSIEDVNEAINAAKMNAGYKDLIFIGGSNFVVAEINDL